MRNIKIIIALFLAVLAVGCSNDNYEAPNTFTALAYTTTWGASTLKESEVNRFISFMDLSNGTTKHEWHIPEGAFFLKGPIANNEKNLEKYIINRGETVSTDKTIHVLFKKGDSNTEVKLYNVFDKYVDFTYPDYYDAVLKATVYKTVKAVQSGNEWIFEDTVKIDVYDTIVAAMKMRDKNGIDIDYKSLKTIDLKVGDQLTFEDISKTINNARPTTSSWRIYTPAVLAKDEVNLYFIKDDINPIYTFTFTKAGSFKGQLTSKRLRTETVNADSQLYDIPVVFNVTP